MKKADFYSLPRAVQDRLVDSLCGRYPPHPVLAGLGPHRTARIWLGIAGAAAVLLCILALVGYGNPASSLALHSTPLVAAYAILVAIAVAGLLEAVALRARVSALPFKPGVYLFQSGVIDARTHRLEVHSLKELVSASATPPGKVTLAFGAARFELALGEPSSAASALEMIESARARAKQDLAPKDRFAIDPLEPPAVASPLGPALSIARRIPFWERGRWLIAAVLGLAIGAGIHHVRNRMSDDRMLALARAKDDVPAYQSYVARGRAHRDLVAREWLPRAALKVAIGQGTVEAIDDFKRSYPDNSISGEIDAARRNALVAEFEVARNIGTLSALLDYAHRYPDHGLGPAFDQAKHALYRAALTRVKAGLPAGSDKTGAFAQRLLAYAEKGGTKKDGDGWRGTEVQVRLGRAPSLVMNRADLAVSKNPMFNGPVSLPSRYFDQSHLAPHEERLAKALAERLGKAFAPEMLRFVAGPTIEVGDEAPSVDVPTLIVTYRIEWSGGAIASKNPRSVLIGLFVFFKTSFVIPGDSEPLTGKFTASENIPRDVVEKFSGVPAPGTVESAVYEAMLADAFSQMKSRYAEKWFKPAK